MAARIDPRIYRPDAYTVDCVIAAGIPSTVATKAIVDGPRATPQRARVNLAGRTRTEPTVAYVWGPDLRFLMGGGR